MLRGSPRTTSWSLALAGVLRALPGLLPTVLVIGLVVCVLVPLPTLVVDLLLSLSLALSVLLLVAALLVQRTTDFLPFPILLLLVTLFRLALNVSTTRLILSQADAGRVIEAFASVVVRDDLLVGGVMFAIITIVQYMVIARGSERVAEVAARFALDGLPGHQAAIDADLRSKAISPREAAARRGQLAERSNFYGAMDGAMRFVKGDAVAGLAITGVNLVGGVIIGATRMGYPVEESLQVYGRLSIGDGLLAQIPALLVSLAAGLLVSRVDRQGDKSPALASWLDPPMLMVPATFLMLMAVMPGMPRVAFAVTGVGLVAAALVMTARRESMRPRVIHDDTARLIVRLGASEAEDVRGLERALSEVRARCGAALRVELPELELRRDGSLPEGQLDVLLGTRRLARAVLPSGSGREDAGVLTLFRAIMDRGELFVDLEGVGHEIDQLRVRQPLLVERALAQVTVVDILGLIRGLLRERIPLPSMQTLLASLVEQPIPEDESGRAELGEVVRQRLAAWWLPDLVDALHGVGARWVRPEPELEEELLEREVRGSYGRALNLTHEERVRWVARLGGGDQVGVRTEDSQRSGVDVRPVAVVASPRARATFARALHGATPHIAVVSTAEFAAAGLALPAALEHLA